MGVHTSHASKIGTLRMKYKITQQKLSDLYGIPKRTIEDWERFDRCPEYVYKLLERAMAEDLIPVESSK